MMQRQAEYEEQIEVMLQKISQLEKAKSRLQSEVEVLIVDLEKVLSQRRFAHRRSRGLMRDYGSRPKTTLPFWNVPKNSWRRW